MTSFQRVLTATALLVLGTGLASANEIGYLSATSTSSAYSLVLNDFNNQGGTLILQSVTLYFAAGENVTNLTITSTDAQDTDVFDLAVQTNFVRNFANSANAANVFSGETLQSFDTGIGTALGNCSLYPSTTVEPNNGCNGITLTPLQSVQYSPYSIANTDTSYGLTTGTGSQGLFGVTLTGTSLSDYVGVGTFTLSGHVQSTQSGDEQGSGVNNSNVNQAGNTLVQAEVDYTYQVVPGSSAPEPATMALMGAALIALGLLARKGPIAAPKACKQSQVV